jgi:hypothetical protein
VRTADFGGIRGTDLTPQVVNLPVDILAPRGTPQLGQLVDFGGATGAVDASAALHVTGPGCVWLAGSAPDLEAEPEGVAPVAVSSTANTAETCLRVPEGQAADLPVRLTTAEAGNGSLAGFLPVVVTPLDALDKQTVVAVPFTADLHRPIKPLNFALSLIAALLLGPGIPLALLALVKWLTAKIPGNLLLVQRMRVRVQEGQVLRRWLCVTPTSGRWSVSTTEAPAGPWRPVRHYGREPVCPRSVPVTSAWRPPARLRCRPPTPGPTGRSARPGCRSPCTTPGSRAGRRPRRPGR